MPAASPANTCTVNNNTTYNASNTNNTGTASALGGAGNTQTVNQNGNNNSGSTGTTGSANFGQVLQGAAGGVANNVVGQIQATGTNNSATIDQGSGTFATRLGGNNNSASVTQSGNGAGVGGAAITTALIYQGQSGQSATINQTRTSGAVVAAGANAAQIFQAYSSTATGGGVNNLANITQNGTNLNSIVFQDDFNNTGVAASNNVATLSQTGLGSTSQVNQGSRGNSATVTLGGGGVNAAGATRVNTSFIQQQNNRVQIAGAAFNDTAAVGTTSANNQANVAIIGTQNVSNVNQNGVNNSATVSMLGGGSGNTGGAPAAGFPANRPEGNTSALSQTGRGNFYSISAGGSTSTNPGGARGNSASVTQGDAGTAPSNVSNARNMRATVYQRGIADTVMITQNNNLNGATVQSGSSVDVSQLGIASSATVNQTGTNSASITQGLNADNSGGQSRLTLTQTDLGDTAGPASDDPFGGGGGTVAGTANTFASAQYGTANIASVLQTSVNASATLFQARLSRANSVDMTQGDGSANINLGGAASPTGANSANLTMSVTQTGNGGLVISRQDGTNNNSTITQAGANTSGATPTASNNDGRIYQNFSFQSGTLSQNGYNLTGRINQSAQNSTAARRSLATITQTGFTQNAIITQSNTSGASPAGSAASMPTGGSATTFPNARPAGAASAEAVILQTQSGNSASITQNGRGQYARIEQNGVNNSGTITQAAAATNAVAILEQNGSGNNLTIAQGSAGQYIRVQQTGNSNVATTTTEFAGAGADGGTVTTGAPIAFPSP